MDRLLTTKEAAKLLDISYKTLYVWNKDGVLKPIILENRSWRYDENTLVEFYTQFCKSKKHQKHTIDDAHSIAREHCGKCLSLEYIDNKDKLKFECEVGHIFTANFNSISSKKIWCRECSNISRRKYFIEDCISYAKVKNGTCRSSERPGYAIFICELGHEWTSRISAVLNTKSWCRMCAGLAKHSIDDCHTLAEKRGGKCLSDRYSACEDKLTWRCNEGHIWSVSFSVVNSGSWCKKCKDNSLKNSIDDCQHLAELKNGKCLTAEYTNALTKMQWQCANGHKWIARYNDIKTGTWCPDCSNQISAAQKEIYSTLSLKYPNLECILNNTKVIAPYDLDIYFPSLNIAIEYDGDYWHYGEMAIKRGSLNRMEKKNELCITNEIKLIRIRESDYMRNSTAQLERIYKLIEET